MKWLSNLLTPIKSELFAMVGVLAVCGVGATIAGYLHIQRQDDQIETKDRQISDLATANKSWAARAAEQDRIRALEQKNVLLLQEKLALIEQQNTDAAAQLKKLEATNAEVKEYLSRPIPADLRRLLQKQ
ncbi:hypothetical protein [Novosphingobium sp. ST904]|uniref:hypothetical protein n=1 Tax=Novosphingobium sp. ST904 TaxID=1684385 RepID=UPI0006C8E236|nr:hypothetical protein [Novosphingobium sp. ST904]KPH60217.1 hypothetical protein ADT71_20605 [Novosphingobium sp. ST904]TCM36919.1 hypothetical protein EDF59_113154 [Novosphingobium sp. ST904]